jgi:hypothetical protein
MPGCFDRAKYKLEAFLDAGVSNLFNSEDV